MLVLLMLLLRLGVLGRLGAKGKLDMPGRQGYRAARHPVLEVEDVRQKLLPRSAHLVQVEVGVELLGECIGGQGGAPFAHGLGDKRKRFSFRWKIET